MHLDWLATRNQCPISQEDELQANASISRGAEEEMDHGAWVTGVLEAMNCPLLPCPPATMLHTLHWLACVLFDGHAAAARSSRR